MNEMRSVTRLIDRIRNGSRGEMEEAAAGIWKRYFPELLRVATRVLDNPRLQPRVDAEDVVVVACRVFFDRQQRGDFDLANRDDLWALLVAITKNKARKAIDHETAGIRDVYREQPVPDAADEDECPGWLTRKPDDSEPPPDEAKALKEQCERLLRTLPKAQRAVAELKLEGHTNKEIAEKLGCVTRTVERHMERIRERLEAAGYGPPA